MVGGVGRREQHQRAGLGDAGEGGGQADRIALLGAAAPDLQHAAGQSSRVEQRIGSP